MDGLSVAQRAIAANQRVMTRQVSRGENAPTAGSRRRTSGSQRGEQLPRLEQDEVAVPAESRRAQRASIVSHVPLTGSTGSASMTAPSSSTPTGVGSSVAVH